MTQQTDAVPEATIARLPAYLRALESLHARGVRVCSSTDLAREAGTQPAQLRRDLSYVGSLGTRGVGYDVPVLLTAVARAVGQDAVWPLLIVGVGNLGSALARQFTAGRFRVVALADSDPAVVGTERHGVRVWAQHELGAAVTATDPAIGVIAVPAVAAQEVCDALVTAGLRTLLNFAPTTLAVNDDVYVRTVDLSLELQILAYHEHQRRQSLG